VNRRELAGVILLGLILTTLLFPLNLTAGDLIQLELFRCPQEPKVGQRLQASLESRGPGETISAWVFFTDKGILGEREYRKAVGERIDELGSRVRIRRLKVRRPEDLVDFADLPVYPPYVQQILDTGVEQRAASRWLNAISVRADGQQIRRLAEFPFVSWLRQVAGGRRHEPEAWENETYELPTEGQFPLDYGPSYTQLKQIAVPQFHSWLEENGLGLPGEGVRICLLDTGFELIHESLQHLDILAQWDFINDDDVVADEDTDPQGQASHGTVVLSVAGGFYPGQLIGPAYGATFLLGKTEDIADEQPIEEA
jgi:serine protease AprX